MDLICCLIMILVVVASAWGLLFSENEDHKTWGFIGLCIGVLILFLAGLEMFKDYNAQMTVKNYIAREYNIYPENVRITAKVCVDSYQGRCHTWEMEARFTKSGDPHIVRVKVDTNGNVIPDKPVPNQLKGARILRSLLILLLLLLPS